MVKLAKLSYKIGGAQNNEKSLIVAFGYAAILFYSLRVIRLIAAIDSKRGIANEHGIPWRLPTDSRYYREKTKGSTVLMGYGTYLSYSVPLPERTNLVLTHREEQLRQGFEKVQNLEDLLDNPKGDMWILGGAEVFAQTINKADELYLTRVEGDFGCTKFFPEFENGFVLGERSEDMSENNVSFRFEIWKHKLKR